MTKSTKPGSVHLVADPAGTAAIDATDPVVAAPALGNAVLEGGHVPVGLTELYHRIDAVLIPRGSALIQIEFPRISPNVDVIKKIYEAELRDGGTVREIDLEKRGRELKLLEPFESVSNIWS
jgi:hypothetical protein